MSMNDDSTLSLVRKALDEFEAEPLEVSARRAYRIARLQGDSAVAHRLTFDLNFGAPAEDRMQTMSAIHGEEDSNDLRSKHNELLEQWIAIRTPWRSRKENDDTAKVHGGSIVELRTSLEFLEAQYQNALAGDDWESANLLDDAVRDRREILERLRQWIFDYLVGTEAQLMSSDAVAQTLGHHRRSVDLLLERQSPELRDQLGAALRAANEGDDESRAHVLLSCRRLIEAVVDLCCPASDQPHISRDGTVHAIGVENIRNRILALIETTGDRAFDSAMGDLSNRLERLDDLLNKGVHATVSERDMEFGLAQSYFLAGELLARIQDSRDAQMIGGNDAS